MVMKFTGAGDHLHVIAKPKTSKGSVERITGTNNKLAAPSAKRYFTQGATHDGHAHDAGYDTPNNAKRV